MGLALLALRISVKESPIYKSIELKSKVKKGDLLMIFKSKERFARYVKCILTGLPIWFVLGVFITFAPEFGQAFGMTTPVKSGDAVLYVYIGLVVGDLSSGLLSQFLKSRRKAIAIFLAITWISTLAFLYLLKGHPPKMLYLMCLPLGFGVGYWAVFITAAAEQFGTNLRATVTTSGPNLVRGAAVPITMSFRSLSHGSGVITASLIVGSTCFLLAFYALWHSSESFHADLDFVEEHFA